MPSANKTSNYNLTQYSNNGSDKISALKDYNEDMLKIDTALNNNADMIATKADAAATYSKTDIDTKLSAVDTKLTTKADAAATYTKTDIDDKLQSKVNVDDRNVMVVFGDSMTTTGSTTEKNWWYIVSQKLNLVAHNYGVGGKGFINGADTPYITQVATAKADSSYDHKKDVRYVFVNGSTNDVGYSVDALSLSVKQFSDAVKAEFPNAELIALEGLCGANVRWTDRADNWRMQEAYPKFYAVSRTLIANGWNVIKNSEFWLLYNWGMSQDDGLHPNDSGHNLIAQGVLQELSGIAVTSPIAMGTDFSQMTSFAAQSIAPPVQGTFFKNYYGWRANPTNLSYAVSADGLGVTLTPDDIKKYATDVVKDSNENITAVYGLRVPIAYKLFPVSRMNNYPMMDTTGNLVVSVNNIPVTGVCKMLYMDTNALLANPSDANEFLWVDLNNIVLKQPDNNTAYMYNFLGGGGNITIRVSFSMESSILGKFVG